MSAPMSVIGVVTISSPGSGSSAATAAWMAAVPDEQATAVADAEQGGEVGLEPLDERALGARQRAAARAPPRASVELLVAERATGRVLIRGKGTGWPVSCSSGLRRVGVSRRHGENSTAGMVLATMARSFTQRPVVDVVEVEPDVLVEGRVAATVDLPHAGDARA